MRITAIIPDKITTPVGGMGEQFKNTYKHLKEEVEINIVGYPDKDNTSLNYRGATNPITHLPHPHLNTLWGQMVYFYEALQFGKPDVVHSYDWTTYMAGYYLAKHYNVPLVLTIQLSAQGLESQGILCCMDPISPDGNWIHNYHIEMEKFCMEKSSVITSVSKSYTRFIPESCKDKTKVIPNGIDLEKWIPYQDVVFPGKNKYKVVYIGRFATMKGVQHLLNANIPKNIDLLLIGKAEGGDGEILNAIDPVLKSKDNVFYIGSMYGQEKIDVLCKADAVVMPSIHEPFGIVALEALASKSILLSSRVDGMGDFLNDKNSIHITSGSEGIENAFNKFLQLTDLDKEKLIQEGIKTCKEYNWKHISQQYLEVYKSLV